MTSSLMTIGVLQSSPSRILQATDTKGKQFVDTLLDDNLKTVVAESAVQRYLTEVWSGNMAWSNQRLTLLFFSFVFFPPVLVYFTLPLSHGYYKVPIVKFLSYLASHIQFIFVLCTVAVVPLESLPERSSFYPTWNEYLLAMWLGGNLTAELTNPTNGSGNRILKALILGLSAIAFLVQVLAICHDLESYEASILMYIRNQIFSIPVMLSVFFIVEFLTFHHRFGPLTIILNYIIQETGISTAIMLIFFVGWLLQLQSIYSPLCADSEPELTLGCECNVRVPAGCAKPFIPSILHAGIPGCRSNEDFIGTMTTNFQLLYGALLHHGDYIWQTAVRNSGEWTSTFTRIQMSTFHIIMVLTILTLIISTSADTYERMNRRSDLEWKYERAKLIRNIIKTAPMPSPFNLLSKPLIYLRAFVKRKGLMCTKYAAYYLMLAEEELGVDDDIEVDDGDIEAVAAARINNNNGDDLEPQTSAAVVDNNKEDIRRLPSINASSSNSNKNNNKNKIGLFAKLRRVFSGRNSQVAALSSTSGGLNSITRLLPGSKLHQQLGKDSSSPATTMNAVGAGGGVDAIMKPGHHETLQDVINWQHVVERYREIEAEESEDEYIEELGCNLSELDEWQAELWEEAEEVEEEEEREIFRNWLIEEFKEVIKS